MLCTHYEGDGFHKITLKKAESGGDHGNNKPGNRKNKQTR